MALIAALTALGLGLAGGVGTAIGSAATGGLINKIKEKIQERRAQHGRGLSDDESDPVWEAMSELIDELHLRDRSDIYNLMKIVKKSRIKDKEKVIQSLTEHLRRRPFKIDKAGEIIKPSLIPKGEHLMHAVVNSVVPISGEELYEIFKMVEKSDISTAEKRKFSRLADAALERMHNPRALMDHYLSMT